VDGSYEPGKEPATSTTHEELLDQLIDLELRSVGLFRQLAPGLYEQEEDHCHDRCWAAPG
jgi:hypothetical protein